MHVKIGDLVTLADRYIPTAKLANRKIQTGIVIDIIELPPRNTLGMNTIDVVILWPDGDLSRTNAFFIKRKE
tara:strand:+ start:235 stop:450 length:216 start_codon:yes stop_codon:yes gene_type:complete